MKIRQPMRLHPLLAGSFAVAYIRKCLFHSLAFVDSSNNICNRSKNRLYRISHVSYSFFLVPVCFVHARFHFVVGII